MKSANYRSRTLRNRLLKPETLMMGYGYAPGLSEGALKPPIFLTSTFVFETAQQGKDFFDLTAGRRKLSTILPPGRTTRTASEASSSASSSLQCCSVM